MESTSNNFNHTHEGNEQYDTPSKKRKVFNMEGKNLRKALLHQKIKSIFFFI